MAWTTQKTWVTGEVLTAPDLNTYVRDDMNYLYSGREAGAISHGSVQSVANATWTQLSLGTVNLNIDAAGVLCATANQFTLPVVGRWLVGAVVAFAGNATGTRGSRIQCSSVPYATLLIPAGTASSFFVTSADVYHGQAATGEIVKLEVFQDSGGALNTIATSGAYPKLWTHRIN